MRVALIGYGFAGKTIHAPLLRSVAGLDLVQIAHRNQVEDVFANPTVELVVISTPNATHFDLAHRALSAGKHVVIDKPFTVTVEEGRQLIALAAERGLFLSVFHSRRWDADFLTVRALLAGGELGELMHFESHYDRYRPKVQDRWREQAGPGSVIWYDLGSHLVDQALQLFGTPDSICGDLAIQREGGAAVDYFHVVLRYGKMRAILHGSNLVAADPPRFILHGTAGSFVKHGMDTQEPALRRGELPGSPGWGIDPRYGTLTTATESRVVETIPGDYRAFYEAVSRGENPVPAEQALQVIEVLSKATAG
ncbi:putative oxidoreductase [Candidatus Sulfopaludibacter sp. SbA3]|nr:putative oxidoreductase [Candidatus Sulfopaludibacter sp. SbA3]